MLGRQLAGHADAQRRRRQQLHRQHGHLRHRQVRRRHQQGVCDGHELGRHDDRKSLNSFPFPSPSNHGTNAFIPTQNVLAATYPDLFAAGIAYAGVPAGCFLSTANAVAGWNSTCSSGQSITTPEHWAAIAEAMDPDYAGARPRMQIYHGSEDTTLDPQNYYETVKQWAGVWGYDYENPESVVQNSPVSGWTRTTWGEGVEGVLAGGVGHSISIQGEGDMAWFGFA